MTTRLDIAKLIRDREGQYSERKSLLEGKSRTEPRDRRAVRDQVADVVAAFANADGGVLILGVEDDGTPTGHRYPTDVVDEILRVPQIRLMPPQAAGVRVSFEGHELLVFDVAAAPVPVMVVGNGYPCRVDDACVKHPAERIQAWKTSGQIESWEARPSNRTVHDLDMELVAQAIAGARLRVDSPLEYLAQRRFVDMHAGRVVLRRAAELLFAAKPWFIDHARADVRILRIIGTHTELGARHNVEEVAHIEGCVPRLIEQSFQSITPLLRKPRRLRGLRFQEIPEYPTRAWQEAIVNAVAHRDYSVTGRGIEVWLYDDRLEIQSPGELPLGISPDDLLSGQRAHVSRNPRLVRGLVDLGVMRDLGEGWPRIIAGMDVQFLARPELVVAQRVVQVTFRNAPQITPADAEWLSRLEGWNLNDAQSQAMILVRRRGAVSNADLRSATGLDTLQASAELRRLCKQGLLEAKGAGPATYYVAGPMAGEMGGNELLDYGGFRPNTRELEPNTRELGPNTRELAESAIGPAARLPAVTRRLAESVTPKTRTLRLRSVIREICRHGYWTGAELATLLQRRSPEHLVRDHLSEMVSDGQLQLRFPDHPNHPDQAYTAASTETGEGNA